MPQHTPSPTHQLNREAKWSVYFTLLYLIGWVVFGYFMPDGTGFLGFPLWFELSCIVLPILFVLISLAVLKAVYKEMDLEGHDKLNDDNDLGGHV